MTLEEAHKRLDEEYKKREIDSCGNLRGKIPSKVRVVAALIATTEAAKAESRDLYFSMSKMKEGE